MKPKLIVLLLGLLAMPAWAAPGTLIKDEDLRASPSSTSAKLASVAKGSTVEVLTRQGGWTQIRAAGRTGWVRILSVRSTVSTTGAGDIAALTSRREGGQVVAVAGLRGLNEEELKSAKFSVQELQVLDRFQVDKAEAEQFARAANLVVRKVAYLPEPKPSASSTNSNAGSGFNIMGGGQ